MENAYSIVRRPVGARIAWLAMALLVSSANTLLAQPTHDRYGGVLAFKGKATGWFHVETFGDRHLWVTPEGHGFFSLGVSHAVDCIRKDELDLFHGRYGGDQKQLSEFILGHLKSWGYNSAGYGALPAMEQQIPYVAVLPTEGPRSLSAGAKSKHTDLFDPAVESR